MSRRLPGTAAGAAGATPRIRPGLLLTLLLAGLAAAWVASQEEPEAPTAARRTARPAQGSDGESRRAPAPAVASARGAAGAAASLDTQARELALAARPWAARGFEPLDDAGRMAWGSLAPPMPAAAPALQEVAAEPPPPTAPPFPYQVVGRWEDLPDGMPDVPADAEPATRGARVIVAAPQATWVLKAGDVIEGQWRIDELSARALRLTYLPLGLPQTVTMR